MHNATETTEDKGGIYLLYWHPGKGTKSYGHVALRVKFRNSTTNLMEEKYISFVPDPDGGNSYKINNNYEADRSLMRRFNEESVDLTGLNTHKLLAKHEEVIQKVGVSYGLLDVDRILAAGGGFTGGDNTGGVDISTSVGGSNCSKYVYVLLSAAGLKTPGLIPHRHLWRCMIIMAEGLVFSCKSRDVI